MDHNPRLDRHRPDSRARLARRATKNAADTDNAAAALHACQEPAEDEFPADIAATIVTERQHVCRTAAELHRLDRRLSRRRAATESKCLATATAAATANPPAAPPTPSPRPRPYHPGAPDRSGLHASRPRLWHRILSEISRPHHRRYEPPKLLQLRAHSFAVIIAAAARATKAPPGASPPCEAGLHSRYMHRRRQRAGGDMSCVQRGACVRPCGFTSHAV